MRFLAPITCLCILCGCASPEQGVAPPDHSLRLPALPIAFWGIYLGESLECLQTRYPVVAVRGMAEMDYRVDSLPYREEGCWGPFIWLDDGRVAGVTLTQRFPTAADVIANLESMLKQYPPEEFRLRSPTWEDATWVSSCSGRRFLIIVRASPLDDGQVSITVSYSLIRVLRK